MSENDGERAFKSYSELEAILSKESAADLMCQKADTATQFTREIWESEAKNIRRSIADIVARPEAAEQFRAYALLQAELDHAEAELSELEAFGVAAVIIEKKREEIASYRDSRFATLSRYFGEAMVPGVVEITEVPLALPDTQVQFAESESLPEQIETSNPANETFFSIELIDETAPEDANECEQHPIAETSGLQVGMIAESVNEITDLTNSEWMDLALLFGKNRNGLYAALKPEEFLNDQDIELLIEAAEPEISMLTEEERDPIKRRKKAAERLVGLMRDEEGMQKWLEAEFERQMGNCEGEDAALCIARAKIVAIVSDIITTYKTNLPGFLALAERLAGSPLHQYVEVDTKNNVVIGRGVTRKALGYRPLSVSDLEDIVANVTGIPPLPAPTAQQATKPLEAVTEETPTESVAEIVMNAVPFVDNTPRNDSEKSSKKTDRLKLFTKRVGETLAYFEEQQTGFNEPDTKVRKRGRRLTAIQNNGSRKIGTDENIKRLIGAGLLPDQVGRRNSDYQFTREDLIMMWLFNEFQDELRNASSCRHFTEELKRCLDSYDKKSGA